MATGINGKQLEQFQDLLLFPREDLDLEIKAWLDISDQNHKADLAQALLALANHGGGQVVRCKSARADGVWPESADSE
jgi:hypothetical protein